MKLFFCLWVCILFVSGGKGGRGDPRRRALLWTERYLGDPELARFIAPLAEQYVALVGRMVPPKELRHAHPHLLLVVENVERALAAAAAENLPGFRQRRRVVREEIQTLEGILRHLKVRLPELPR